MSDLNDINFEIKATQNAICNYEAAIYNAGYSVNEVDKDYGGNVPDTLPYFKSKEKAKEHLVHLEHYFSYLTVAIRKLPGALELT